MHIYWRQMYPPNWAQISGKPLHCRSFTYSRMHIYPWQTDPGPPPPIEHRSLANHYTKYVSYIAECTYMHGRLTPPCLLQLSIDLWKTTKPNRFYKEQNAHIPMADWHDPLPPISIDLCNTTMLSFINCRMHIYPWQTDPTTSSNSP